MYAKREQIFSVLVAKNSKKSRNGQTVLNGNPVIRNKKKYSIQCIREKIQNLHKLIENGKLKLFSS